jgi:hypothetical protein
LREALQACDFTEPAICTRFAIRRVSELRTAGDFDPGDDPTDVLGILVRLFIGGCAVRLLATAASDADMLLQARPRAGKHASLRVEHRLADGEWQPQFYRLESVYPFSVTMRVEPWAAHLLTIADGSLTTRELLDRLISAGGLPASAEPAEFARIIAAMVFGGLLEVDEYRLPAVE